MMAIVIAGGKGSGKGHGITGLYNTYITERTFPYITGRMFSRVRFNFFMVANQITGKSKQHRSFSDNIS